MSWSQGFQVERIVSPGGVLGAEFLPAANMVCGSLRHREAELLAGGHGASAYAQRGKTMGIPLLHPWANRLQRPGYTAGGKTVELPAGGFPTDPAGLPIHGVLPGMLVWDVTGSAGDRLSARLRWEDDELLALFPFVHELRLEARVEDDRLTLATTLEATGSDRVPVAFGYHPYLALPGSHRRFWRVRLGATRRLLLDARMLPTGESEPLAEREFSLGDQSWDDALGGLSVPSSFEVAGGGRRLTVEFEEGYPYAQVFAPPAQDFICFEPMTAPGNALVCGDGLTVLEPGETYRARFSIAISG